MKSYALIVACSVIAGFSGNSFAALVGSPRPVARKNFQKLIKTNECPSCDLAGVVLNRVDLSEANLEGANLAGAKLYLANLSNANLKNANLQGAGLGGADLCGADLRGANLTGAVLEGAYLKGAQLDGRIIADKPYEAEDLPDVAEQKYVADESRSKNVPYTQDVVVGDRRDLGETTPPAVPGNLQVKQEEAIEPPDTGESSAIANSKMLVPMADAVVHTSGPEKPADVQMKTEAVPAADESVPEAGDDTGIWGSIVSFFGGDSEDSGDQAEEDATVTGQESAEGAAEGVATGVDEVVTDTSTRTGKDELAPDAGVRAMIEQIEGPPPEPEKVEIVEQDTGARGEVTAGPPDAEVKPGEGIIAETEQVSAVEEEAVVEVTDRTAEGDAAKTGMESSAADGPAAGASVSSMIVQIEADQLVEPIAPGDTVYTVETPEQAKAKRQMIIDRLLDEERCVACDLAGVDLSGKNLDEVDLERANLQGANLAGIDLSEANLKGVNFSGANLRDADLREADLYLADFTGANLTGAKFEGALIDSANFTDAKGANLKGAVKDE